MSHDFASKPMFSGWWCHSYNSGTTGNNVSTAMKQSSKNVNCDEFAYCGEQLILGMFEINGFLRLVCRGTEQVIAP